MTGSLLLSALALRATSPPGATELDIYALFSSFPRALVPFFRALEGLGSLWIVGLLGAATLLARRWRLARDLALSGVLAWGTSRVLGSDVVGHVGLRASLHTLTHAGVTPSFPFVRVAVLVAVVATASPYVSRPTRRLGQLLVSLSIVAGLYVASVYPSDLLGGLVTGWAVGAAVHLLFRSPGGRPSSWQLRETLPRVGIDARAIRLAPQQTAGVTTFLGQDRVGPLVVNVIGRDERDAQLMAKTWRTLAYKEPSSPRQLSRLHQVEHEACMTLLAGSAGVRVPQVVFVGRAGPGSSLLVLRPLPGLTLSGTAPAAVTGELLAAIWSQVTRLHRSGVAHGSLDADHVVVTGKGPGIISFAGASTSDLSHHRARDIAELLAATAGIVGDDRAIRACAETLGPRPLATAVRFLQPAALGARTRSSLGTSRRDVQHRVDGLRRAVALTAGVEVPQLQQLQRLRPGAVAMVIGSLVAVGLLLDQVGTPAAVWAIARHAEWGWLMAAIAFSLVTNVPYAIALMGTIPLRLPLWPTIELQLAMSYPNLVIPVVGGTGFQIRFLQRQGAGLPAAVAAGGLLSLVGTVATNLPLFVLAVVVSPHELRLGNISVGRILELVLILIFGLGALAALALGIPRLRRVALPPIKEAGTTVWTALRSPRQLSLMIGGNLGVDVLFGLCLLACLQAYGATLSFWSVLAVSVGIGSLAALVPIPGGGTAVGAVGLTAALAGLGIRTEVAVAATLTNQLAVSYVPALPGWFATRHLLRRSDL